MDVNFEYYKVFYYVAKYGNITRAATALGSSQPNVTRVMKLLEEQLSCRLLVREARGVSLTEEGEKLYVHVEAAFRQLLNAQEEICGQEPEGRGTVEIGATETALHLFLLEAMGGFRDRYPRTRIKIHNHTTPEILKKLQGGRLDFAVVTSPFEVSGNFLWEDLLDFREILVGGRQYGYLGGRSLTLGELKKYPWVGLGRGTATYEWYKDFFIERGVDMELDMEVATSDLMFPLLQSNMGIGFVPEILATPLLREGSLVKISLDCPIPGRSIQLISDRGRGKSPAAARFREYLRGRSPGGCLGEAAGDQKERQGDKGK